MAALVTQDRLDLLADTMRGNVPVVGITKADLAAAVNAIDDWVVANAAAFNSAIPQPARGALTAAQKAKLLSMVAQKRFDKGA